MGGKANVRKMIHIWTRSILHINRVPGFYTALYNRVIHLHHHLQCNWCHEASYPPSMVLHNIKSIRDTYLLTLKLPKKKHFKGLSDTNKKNLKIAPNCIKTKQRHTGLFNPPLIQCLSFSGRSGFYIRSVASAVTYSIGITSKWCKHWCKWNGSWPLRPHADQV